MYAIRSYYGHRGPAIVVDAAIAEHLEVLLAQGRDAASRMVEREFERYGDAVRRDIGQYPSLHQALAEATDGAGRGAEVVFGVILGTGVGGGIVVQGKILEGPNAIAGEWGHNPLPLPGAEDLPLPACYCGRAGCIETYLSGPGMSAA